MPSSGAGRVALPRACSPETRALIDGEVDYLAVVDPATFVEIDERPGAIVVAAARFGPTRLIDTVHLEDT